MAYSVAKNCFCCSLINGGDMPSSQFKFKPIRLPTGRRGRQVGAPMQLKVSAQVDNNEQHQHWDGYDVAGSVAVNFLRRIRVMEEEEEEEEGDEEEIMVSKLEDWRTFRARLICTPLADLDHSTSGVHKRPPAGHGSDWVHKITRLEEGCILMATHQLDGHPLLHRSVVLLTQGPSKHGDINPTWKGVLMNKRLPYPVSQVEGVDTSVALGVGACSAFLGGSLLMSPCNSPFHAITRLPLHGHRALRSDLRVGTGDSALLSAWAGIQRKLILPSQVRVHVGQLKWDIETLAFECDVLQWWQILSCSSSLLLSDNVDSMWHSLQLLLEEEESPF